MTMVITIIMIFHDRYDQSTAEAFRAVQKSGEMVKVKQILLDFCKTFFYAETLITEQSAIDERLIRIGQRLNRA